MYNYHQRPRTIGLEPSTGTLWGVTADWTYTYREHDRERSQKSEGNNWLAATEASRWLQMDKHHKRRLFNGDCPVVELRRKRHFGISAMLARLPPSRPLSALSAKSPGLNPKPQVARTRDGRRPRSFSRQSPRLRGLLLASQAAEKLLVADQSLASRPHIAPGWGDAGRSSTTPRSCNRHDPERRGLWARSRTPTALLHPFVLLYMLVRQGFAPRTCSRMTLRRLDNPTVQDINAVAHSRRVGAGCM